MTNLVFPDVMFDMRAWLRGDATLFPLHGGRVFWRLPNTPVTPMMLIRQVGGGVQTDSESPLQDIQTTVETWGMQNGDYQKVRQLDLALQHICQLWPAGNSLNPTGNTKMHNVSFNGSFDSPDPSTGWPRKIAHLTLTVSATSPTVV